MLEILAQTEPSTVCQVDPNSFWELMFHLGLNCTIHFVMWMISQWFFRM